MLEKLLRELAVNYEHHCAANFSIGYVVFQRVGWKIVIESFVKQKFLMNNDSKYRYYTLHLDAYMPDVTEFSLFFSALCTKERPFGQEQGVAPNKVYFCCPDVNIELPAAGEEPTARQCTSCEPTATTNCANFGNIIRSCFLSLVVSKNKVPYVTQRRKSIFMRQDYSKSSIL